MVTLKQSVRMKEFINLVGPFGGSCFLFCLLVVWFWFGFIETTSCYVAQAGLQFVILLPLPPKCWDYRYAHHTWLYSRWVSLLLRGMWRSLISIRGPKRSRRVKPTMSAEWLGKSSFLPKSSLIQGANVTVAKRERNVLQASFLSSLLYLYCTRGPSKELKPD
jgi:hypothetical protein